MKKLSKSLKAIAFSSLISGSAFAQAPKYSNEFLSIGVGARALGMANAQVSDVNDITAGYWNPAGLIGIKNDIQVGLMHSEYFAGLAKYDYGAIAVPIDKTSTVGVSFIRFAVDDIPDTSELIDPQGNVNYDRIKSFAAADYAFILSYARRHKYYDNLTYGANAKVIYRNVGEFASAWGFGIDLGAQLKLNEHFQLGATIKDVTSTFNAWSFNADKLAFLSKTGNAIPQNGLELTLPRLIFGGSYRHDFSNKITALAALDLDFTTDGKRNVPIKTSVVSIDPHAGIEIGYDNFIFLRAGVGNVQQIKSIADNKTYTTFQPNIGVGIKLKRLTVDYAFTNIGGAAETLYSNIISLKLDINRSH
jgi:hypothetical protein